MWLSDSSFSSGDQGASHRPGYMFIADVALWPHRKLWEKQAYDISFERGGQTECIRVWTNDLWRFVADLALWPQKKFERKVGMWHIVWKRRSNWMYWCITGWPVTLYRWPSAVTSLNLERKVGMWHIVWKRMWNWMYLCMTGWPLSLHRWPSAMTS